MARFKTYTEILTGLKAVDIISYRTPFEAVVFVCCEDIGGLANTEFVVVAVRISSADIVPINIPAVDISYIKIHDSSLINKYLY